MDTTERRFARLTHLVLDGVATDKERTELARFVAAHPEQVTTVFDELTLDALLKWQSGNILEELPFVDCKALGSSRSPMQESRKSGVSWTWMIAATFLIATGLAAWRIGRTKPVEHVVADIIHQQGVHWSDETTALAVKNAVLLGRLSSTSGEYTLQFREGSTVRVVGPSSLDIKSKMLVQLDHGQATARVPEGSTGFTITSALVNVVDLGTEFGISVEDGQADVVVFDGKVDVESNFNQSGTPKRLNPRGRRSMSIEQGSIDRLADIRRDVDGRWWGSEARTTDTCHCEGDYNHGGEL